VEKQKYIRLSQAAQRLGMSREALREAIKRGDLPARRLGPRGHYLFLPADLEQALQPQAPDRESQP
jgi:excisionase family DNA binding protein